MSRARFTATVDIRPFEALHARIREASGTPPIQVGIPEGLAHPDADITIAEIGAIHEFGSPKMRIPARSWLRRTFTRRAADLKSEMRKVARAVTVEGVSLHAALGQLGVWAVRAVKQTIHENIPPPLKDATIAKKGHRLALIDSGALIRAITWWRTRGR